jgi:diguanylate cyclase (GGDEF)-like protein
MEERFDRIARITQRLFDVPISLVSIVDENRQWFKSHLGLDVRETPREVSFCGHAILGEEIFVVEDSLKDERFRDNPLVTGEPKIRFYAGCPIRDSKGLPLGTLCILDNKPRKLSAADLDIFSDLARLVELEIAGLYLATLDELTNISNRRGFLMLAEHGLKLCTRKNIPASLIFLDLDKFKPINDEFGHAEGDAALKNFAEQLKIRLRSSDVFARIGGDEFAALLTNTSSLAATGVIERFNELLGEFNREEDRGYNLEFSFGVVDFNPQKHSTVEKLLADGDLMMYDSKKQKRYQEHAAAEG